jgi:hypothetical protein
MAAVPQAYIRDALGHRTLAMSDRYMHFAPSSDDSRLIMILSGGILQPTNPTELNMSTRARS